MQLSNVTLIILCAGSSTRFGLPTKKQWLRVENTPLWLFVTKQLSSYYQFEKVIITSSEDELHYMRNFSNDVSFVKGGTTRQESIKNALQEVTSQHVMITDVARCCVPKNIILELLNNKNEADCIVPVLNVSDTVIYNEKTIDRNNVKLIQTPQLSNTKCLKTALTTKQEYTDDSSAIKANHGKIKYIAGSSQSKKLTHADDLKNFKQLASPIDYFFSGSGLDIHAFEENKPMVLGGIEIESPLGFKAHSDGDVLIHSVIDALLGACGAGDIGEFFPDTDDKYKGADSKELLSYIVTFIKNVGYEIVNIDLTIIAQKPKINPYKRAIKLKMAELLGIESQFVNIKATTAEKLGFLGRSEGIAVQSNANVKYFDWKKL